MLVLSTVGTLVSLYGLLSLPLYVARIGNEPVFSITNLVTAALVTPAAVLALVLLWRKHPLGIWLKLNTYGASVVAFLVLLLFTERSAITKLVEQSQADLASTGGLSEAAIEQIVNVTYYGTLVISIVASIVFALLWWSAWKRQLQADGGEA